MILPISFREEALDESAQAVDYYEGQRPGSGRRFSQQLQRALDHAAAMPRLQPVLYKDVRPAQLKRFPYTAYYRVEPGRILVLAVLHAGRDPSMWRGRA